jgi:hypothetical protein
MCIMIVDRTDSTDAMDTPDDAEQDEAKRVLGLLDTAILNSRRSRREIERKLGWSQGYLGSLLRGRISLKVWHVYALSRELGIEPLSLFLTAAPPRDPSWILKHLGIEPLPPAPPEEPVVPKVEAPPMSREDLEEMMRTLLYHELGRLGLLDEPT